MTDDRETDQVKDLLQRTAPARPDLAPAERVAAVTHRARVVRRRQGLAAAAVLAVVAGGVGWAVLGGSDDGPAPVAQDPPAPAAPVACPDPAPVYTEVPTEAEFPVGATSLRLCPGRSDAGAPTATTQQFRLPTEPLTDGVDALLDEVAAQPAYTGSDPECAFTTLALEPWILVAGYPDGSTVSVGSGSQACSSVTVDGTPVDVGATLALVGQAVTG
ncbi:hypothetical protein [Nocardioides litoris]|uniref:hypothetical protein n=1 Tax=Nocardioides litoris TaxID=1926648 RepID=UPI00111F6F82|nr:hypothetical protein [Nocardioides litoris]